MDENLGQGVPAPQTEKFSLTRKTVIGAVAILILIAVAGYFAKPYFSGKPLTTAQELELQKQAADIIKTKDFSQCGAIKNDMYRTVCTNNIALNLAQETGDISYCAKIDGELVPREECERNIIFSKSVETENVAVCSETKSQELKNQCEISFYMALASKKNDVSICESAPKEARAFCKDDFLVSQAIAANAVAKLNCDTLENDALKKDCRNAAALSEKSAPEVVAGVCQTMSFEKFRQYCLSLLGGSPYYIR